MAGYLLKELLEKDRRDYPAGQSFAVKRAQLGGDIQAIQAENFDEVDDDLRLTILNAEPEEYISDGGGLTSGLQVARFALYIQEIGIDEVFRRKKAFRPLGSTRMLRVKAVSYAGDLLLGNDDSVPAVGAYVPGETSTSYVHVLDRQASTALFSNVDERSTC